jgi:hypothetical protein
MEQETLKKQNGPIEFSRKLREHPSYYLRFYDIGYLPWERMWDLGRDTLEGMAFYLAEAFQKQLGREACHGSGRDSRKTECTDALLFILDLLSRKDLIKKPCLPTYRNPKMHFTEGCAVYVWFEGRWIPGTVIESPYEDYKYTARGERPTDIVMEVEAMNGLEELDITLEYQTAMVFRQDEIDYLVGGGDRETLWILQENTRHHLKVRNRMEVTMNELEAIANLVYLSANVGAQAPAAIGDELMVLRGHEWVEAVVYSEKTEFDFAVVNVLGDCPEMMNMSGEFVWIHKKEWSHLTEIGKIF